MLFWFWPFKINEGPKDMDLDDGFDRFLDCWIFGPIVFGQVNPNIESIQ
jgi:hypothetical protein